MGVSKSSPLIATSVFYSIPVEEDNLADASLSRQTGVNSTSTSSLSSMRSSFSSPLLKR